MKKKIRILLITIITIFFFVVAYVPFVNSKDEFRYYCRYRLAVYECRVCESEGEGCYSDFFFFNVELNEKIGGTLEYFGLKEVKNDNRENNDN